MRAVWLILATGLLGACGTLLSVSADPDPLPAQRDASAPREAGDGAPDASTPPPTDAAVDVDAGPPRPIAFVSSQAKPGDIGRPAFDALCRNLALTAGLPGTYAALLGAPNARPVEALKSTTWFRVDGELLFDGSLTSPVVGFFTDKNVALPGSALVWTGGPQSQSTCADWSDGGPQGGIGNPNAPDARWLSYGSSTCSISNHVYCFEQ
jgi:hypothetical protein